MPLSLLQRRLGTSTLLFGAASAWAQAAFAQTPYELPIVARTTLPEGTWALSANVRVSYVDRPSSNDGTNPGAATSSSSDGVSVGGSLLIPDISYGITDRLQLGVTTPGIAYRFGDVGGVEWIPSLGAGIGGGYSNMEGALFTIAPVLGLDVRSWLGDRTHLTVGGSVGSVYWHRGGHAPCEPGNGFCAETSRVFENWVLRGQLAFTHTFGSTATMALGGYVAYSFNRLEAADNDSVFGLGSPVRSGIWTAPPLRFHVARWMSVDLFGGYARTLTSASNWVWGGVGATFLW